MNNLDNELECRARELLAYLDTELAVEKSLPFVVGNLVEQMPRPFSRRRRVKPRIENIPLTLGGKLHLFEKTSIVYVLPGAAKGSRSHVALGKHRQGNDHEC